MFRLKSVLLLAVMSLTACSVRDVTVKPDPPKATKAETMADGKATADAPKAMADAPKAKPCPKPIPTNNNLNSVAWVQTATEYDALALQTYANAKAILPEAIKDRKWTAAPEQQQVDVRSLKPAIIVDVDETVLDNSAYQARLIKKNELYSPKTWGKWTKERKAGAVPGAVDFLRTADNQGVKVFYVTNRDKAEERDTRANLLARGFPINEEEGEDVVMMRGEKEDWGSDKTTRRQAISFDYRIIMLIGDNLGDFMSAPKGTPAERDTAAAKHRDWWGQRWFMLPNPTYGSWERALIGKERDLGKRTDVKRSRLKD